MRGPCSHLPPEPWLSALKSRKAQSLPQGGSPLSLGPGRGKSSMPEAAGQTPDIKGLTVCVCVCVRGQGWGRVGRNSGADLWEVQKRHLPSRSGTTKVTKSPHRARGQVTSCSQPPYKRERGPPSSQVGKQGGQPPSSGEAVSAHFLDEETEAQRGQPHAHISSQVGTQAQGHEAAARVRPGKGRARLCPGQPGHSAPRSLRPETSSCPHPPPGSVRFPER